MGKRGQDFAINTFYKTKLKLVHMDLRYSRCLDFRHLENGHRGNGPRLEPVHRFLYPSRFKKKSAQLLFEVFQPNKCKGVRREGVYMRDA